jgi:signal peptidase II
VVFATTVGCDQLSKDLARDNLKHAAPASYLGNTFRLQYAENSGAFLSFGSGLSEPIRTSLFTYVSGGLLVGLLIYILVNHHFSGRRVIALSLILGGGSSNLLDRVLNDGRVVDFMIIGIGNLRTGIFNLADSGIMLGMGLVILFSFMERSKKIPNNNSRAPKDY